MCLWLLLDATPSPSRTFSKSFRPLVSQKMLVCSDFLCEWVRAAMLSGADLQRLLESDADVFEVLQAQAPEFPSPVHMM